MVRKMNSVWSNCSLPSGQWCEAAKITAEAKMITTLAGVRGSRHRSTRKMCSRFMQMNRNTSSS